jgi:hypothetical protein
MFQAGVSTEDGSVQDTIQIFTEGLGYDKIRAITRFRDEWARREANTLEQARLAQETGERRTKRQQLTKQAGEYQIANLGDMAPNPFIWRGKLIGTCVMFTRMLGPTTASVRGGLPNFAQASVTGVPSSRFTREIVVFMVARVGASANGNLALQYVAAVDQPGDDGCSDFIDR